MEPKIEFMPNFKLINEDRYDFNEIPSYTDWIFYALSKFAVDNMNVSVLEYDWFKFKGMDNFGV